MTFMQFFSILRARWIVAIGVFTLIVVGTVGVSLLLAKQYLGVASVVIDVKPDPVSAMGYPTVAMPGFIATQSDIIQSDRVALRVIRDLKLLDNPQIRGEWQQTRGSEGSFQQWLVDLLQKQLDVKPSRESNVITISYKAQDPRFAAAMANAFAQAYIATTLELRVDPAKQYANFFDIRSKDARDSLEKAQAKLSAFQREKGIIASDERLDVENARLNELSSQLVALQAITAESGSRQTQSRGASGDRMPEVLNNALVAGMKADLTRSEAKMQELNSRYGDNHPQVIEARANIAELRRRIDGEVSRVTGGIAVTNTINRQREVQVRDELEKQRSKLLRLKAVRDEGLVLSREVENAQRGYDVVMARYTQTNLESLTTQSYVNMLTTAEPPSQPASPRILLNGLIAAVAGAMLALGTAFLVEISDRRIRAPEDVVAYLDLPVIGSLPKPGAKRYIRGRRFLPMEQRIAGLPSPSRSA